VNYNFSSYSLMKSMLRLSNCALQRTMMRTPWNAVAAAAQSTRAFSTTQRRSNTLFINFNSRHFATVQSVPSMGDSISEGVVESKWICVGVGEYVEADEVVARIETDKVTVDILS